MSLMKGPQFSKVITENEDCQGFFGKNPKTTEMSCGFGKGY